MVKDLTNRKFGRLTAIKIIGKNQWRTIIWECACECGNTTSVSSNSLLTGNTKSCGCLSAELATQRCYKHGRTYHPLFTTYRKMIDRCYNKNHVAYKNYGGRGIAVCERWRGEHGFENFVLDMGEKPSPKYQLDRTDNNGNYEPSNCRFVLPKINMRNSGVAKLNSDKVALIRKLYGNGTYKISELAPMFNVSHSQVSSIVHNKSWI